VQRAMPHFKKAEALLDNQPESIRHGIFYLTMAGAYGWTKRIGDGLASAKRAMEISERLDLDGLWSIAAVMSAGFLVQSGSVNEGLRLTDRARRRADAINDTMVGSNVAWIGSLTHQALRNPREVQDWCTSELAKPRTAHAVRRVAPDAPPRNDNVPLIVHNKLVIACIEAGELAKARAYLAEVDNTHKPAELLFIEGEWELAGKKLTANYDRCRTNGDRARELGVAFDLARLHRFIGERAQASQFLQRELEGCVDGGDILQELATRSTLATMAADAGDTGEALPHLERCRQIVGAGENWFGIAGLVERAEVVVAAAQGQQLVAETQFKKAIATFQRYCLPWEEADTFQYWGRALLAASERARAIEKFDAAIEIYRSRGAGMRFIEYVMVDKLRAQGVEKLGLQMRAGIHTGECELVGGDAIGIAVHIGARVAAQAGPNEVMVSSTVRDLLVGGEITFVDRGVSELKGIPGEWRLYAVERQG